jgi:hypothetical protein
VDTELGPLSASIGDEVVVWLVGVPAGGTPASVIVWRISDVDTAWLGEVGVTGVSGAGYEGRFSVGIDEECVAFATQVRMQDGSTVETKSNSVAVNAKTGVAAAEDVDALRLLLGQRQAERYDLPLGRVNDIQVIEHRVLCVVERLLLTTPLRLPGVKILPVKRRPNGSDQYLLLDELIKALDWSTPNQPAITFSNWEKLVEPNRPWTAIVCAPVFAETFNEAAEVAWKQRERLIAVLGLARGARGRAVATFVQQRQADDSIKYRLFVEDERYTGNLMGGFLSGEDQRSLLVNVAALEADPLLSLLVDLFSEALADPSADARYLRFWSILETLSGARISDSQPVTLLDGSPYPGGVTTTQAAPRVYRLLADYISVRNFQEASFSSPAASLYEAVRAWYARRNATGHYGRLDPTDPRQAQQGWMQWAQLTSPAPNSPDNWLTALQRAVERVLHAELTRVGRPLTSL